MNFGQVDRRFSKTFVPASAYDVARGRRTVRRAGHDRRYVNHCGIPSGMALVAFYPLRRTLVAEHSQDNHPPCAIHATRYPLSTPPLGTLARHAPTL